MKNSDDNKNYNRHVIVDVETSGMSPAYGGRVIEIGAVSVIGSEIISEYNTLINVDCQIHPGAYHVHGISKSMLSGWPSPEVVWPDFLDFIGDSPLVAHNASFDMGFIRFELARLRLSIDNEVKCSLALSRKALKNLPSHRLSSVAVHVLGKIPADIHLHRALGDAKLLANIWIKMNGFC